MSQQVGTIYRWQGMSTPSVSELLRTLRQVEWLPAKESWWFGWQEFEIQLPSILPTKLEQDETWDVLHFFSPSVECRRFRRGGSYRWLLLTEKPLPLSFSRDWKASGAYTPIASKRIMWGEKLHLPSADHSKVEVSRGQVNFPRRLDYEVSDEKKNYHKAIVADVLLYYDSAARLQTVRYQSLSHLRLGDKNALAEPLDNVMESFSPVSERSHP